MAADSPSPDVQALLEETLRSHYGDDPDPNRVAKRLVDALSAGGWVVLSPDEAVAVELALDDVVPFGSVLTGAVTKLRARTDRGEVA